MWRVTEGGCRGLWSAWRVAESGHGGLWRVVMESHRGWSWRVMEGNHHSSTVIGCGGELNLSKIILRKNDQSNDIYKL